MPPNTNEALELLRMAIETRMKKGLNLNRACIPIAKKLKYDRTYVINMYRNQTLSIRAAKRIMKVLGSQKKRYRIAVEFDNKEDKEAAMELPMEERVGRLLG